MVPYPFATGTRRQARVHLEGRLWRSRRAWRVGWACCQLLPSSPQTRPIKTAAAAAAKTLTDDISAPSSIHELSLTCLESWHRAASNEPSSFSRCFGPIVPRGKNVKNTANIGKDSVQHGQYKSCPDSVPERSVVVLELHLSQFPWED